MVNDVPNDLVAHVRWISSVPTNPTYYHWIYGTSEQAIGLASISQLDMNNHSTSWGYYVGDENSVGIGAWVPPYMYNWLFGLVGIKKIHAEVLATNRGVLKMHSFHGYRRQPTRDRTIRKNGKCHELVALELNAATWHKFTRLQHYRTDFPVSGWLAGPESLKSAQSL